MHQLKPQAPMSRLRGFTLIELMIAVVVVAVLAALAFPSFLGSIRKGRRADAASAVNAVQQAQERWRSSHESYATNAQLTLDPPNGLGLKAVSASGYYAISISGSSATSYTVTADASGVSGSGQARDSDCVVMGIQLGGGQLKFGSGASSIDWSAENPDPKRCWAK